MTYRWNKDQIKGKGIWLGEVMNRHNAGHLPELIQMAQKDLLKAQSMPHATPAHVKAKAEAVAHIKETLDIRQQKLALYREVFPDLNL